jgi:hypothetical protein
MWVRPQNAVLMALLSLETLADLAITLRSKSHPQPVLLRGLFTLAGFLIAFAPLLLFWRTVYGAWIVNTYAATQGSAIFDWRAPHLLQVLFSSNRGLFVWAPVTLPALVGLWWLSRIHTRLAALLLGMFMGQLYVVGSWFAWAGDVSFGPRFWVNMTIVFGMGLAALINRRWPRSIWIALAGIFVIWNLLLIVQYSLNTVPHSGAVDLVKMIQHQFTIIPENLQRILHALIVRQ